MKDGIVELLIGRSVGATMTLDEISEYISALYGETQPIGEFKNALMTDALQKEWFWTEQQRRLLRLEVNLELFPLVVRALRNQGEPYYDKVQP